MLMTLQPNKIIQEVHQLLEERLAPTKLTIRNDTHKHIKHAQYVPGKLHIEITIQSESFVNLNRIQQHKLIYQILAPYQQYLHAIAIKSSSTTEN